MGYFDEKEPKSNQLDKLVESANTEIHKMAGIPKKFFGKEKQYEDVDIVQLNNINQTYIDKGGKENVIFKDFNFKIKDVKDKGQFVVIVGASGCGKSTILRYIAGLQKPTSGDIILNGQMQTEKDRVGMVFQQYSSLPWRTVLDNVAFPLELQGVPKEERIEKAMKMIKLVGLSGHEYKYAQYPILSGGQLQRIALARNLVAGNEMLLLDEPHSGLDITTKLEMDNLLCDIWADLNKTVDSTFVMVTHDLTEAVYLADEIYVMDANPGRIVEELHLDLPLERNATIKRTKQFTDYVHYLEDLMMKIEKK